MTMCLGLQHTDPLMLGVAVLPIAKIHDDSTSSSDLGTMSTHMPLQAVAKHKHSSRKEITKRTLWFKH
jgi:hypothetical protein